mmetsp:Transcript_96935/g.312985  ORF Transcript_96935/g.312985 Transcript_96935/m.312985 type:complete len:217 (+) Transcript_96935:197-847(+)
MRRLQRRGFRGCRRYQRLLTVNTKTSGGGAATRRLLQAMGICPRGSGHRACKVRQAANCKRRYPASTAPPPGSSSHRRNATMATVGSSRRAATIVPTRPSCSPTQTSRPCSGTALRPRHPGRLPVLASGARKATVALSIKVEQAATMACHQHTCNPTQRPHRQRARGRPGLPARPPCGVRTSPATCANRPGLLATRAQRTCCSGFRTLRARWRRWS